MECYITKKRESARTKSQQKVIKTLKINPEGTCGPIWPGVVPLVLSNLWLYYRQYVKLKIRHILKDHNKRLNINLDGE